MKLLATDYDGTLRYAQDVMPEDLKSIEEWKNKGNKFVIVTGRSKESIDAQIKLFNLPCDYLITNNGGMVFGENGDVLLSNYLNFDVIYCPSLLISLPPTRVEIYMFFILYFLYLQVYIY